MCREDPYGGTSLSRARCPSIPCCPVLLCSTTCWKQRTRPADQRVSLTGAYGRRPNPQRLTSTTHPLPLTLPTSDPSPLHHHPPPTTHPRALSPHGHNIEGMFSRRCTKRSAGDPHPKVSVYGGPTVGWQRGIIKDVMHGSTWTSSAFSEEAFQIVTRATEPVDGQDTTDFSVVPDPRLFEVEVAGEVQNLPAHLVFLNDDAEPC